METEEISKEEVEAAIRRQMLKHSVEKVLEKQEVLAQVRADPNYTPGEDSERDWTITKARIGYKYHNTELAELLKESGKEGEVVIVFQPVESGEKV